MPALPSLTTRVIPWAYEKGVLRLLDQRLLPHQEVWLDCAGAAETAEAIRSLAVRGAPLIGVAAAFGLAAEARRVASRSPVDLDAALLAAAARLESARPTAVNLAAAVRRMRAASERDRELSPEGRVAGLEAEAARIAEEDRLACEEIGRRGAAWLSARLGSREKTVVLTHCNAGALATAGIGTALGVIRALAAERPLAVFADETRPFLQGARLTAWELQRDGVEVTLLPDVAAAGLIRSGRVAAAVVGADRIARNGDVANKVGTYGVALACRAAGIPFMVAAPTTTLDPDCPDGNAIPIEVRSADEVLEIGPVRIAPVGIHALYPAFDVTPADLVDAIVTERGVSERPHDAVIAEWTKR